MPNFLKERIFEKTYAEVFAVPNRRESLVDGDVSGRTSRAVEKALGRLPKIGIADFGPGNFEGFRINKPLEILCREPGTTEITGTVEALSRVTAVLSSVILRPPPGVPALVVEGVLLCDDLDIYGSVEVRAGGVLLMRNCRVAVSSTGIGVAGNAEAEITACRISGSPAGVNAEPGSKVSIYSSRMEACFGNAEAENGAGLYAEKADAHVEGCEFFRNDVGLCLNDCNGAEVLFSRFHANASAAFVATHPGGDRPLIFQNCVFDGIQARQSAVVSLEGGRAEMRHSKLDAAHGGIEAANCALIIEGSKVATADGAALAIDGGSISAVRCEFSSANGPAVSARAAVGTLTASKLDGGHGLLDEGGSRIQIFAQATPAQAREKAPDPVLAEILATLDQIVGQQRAVAEIERIFRLAHISSERMRQGLPMASQRHSALFCGPRGCGKRDAATLYAAGLHRLGMLESPHVVDLTLADTPSIPIRAGLVFLRTAPVSGLVLNSSVGAELVAHLIRNLPARGALVLDGDRNLLRGFLRSRPEIAREIPLEVVFSAFQPPELCALFEAHCVNEHIPIGADAAKKLLVVVHALHDRLHRRYTDRAGLAELFAETRQNYLERCALEGRFDIQLAAEDIAVPVDRAFTCAIERSGDFVAICPHCGSENPWVPGLNDELECGACGDVFPAPWGLLRTSSFFRRLKSRGDDLMPGAVARRRLGPSKD